MDELRQRCRNLIRFDQPGFPFTDAFSNFSVGLPASAPMGLGPLHPRAVLSTYHIAEPLLQAWLTTGGTWRAVRRQELTCWPWLAHVSANSGNLKVDADHVFIDASSLLSTWKITNTSPIHQEFSLAWTGIARPEGKLYMLPYFDGADKFSRDLKVTTGKSCILSQLKVAPGIPSKLPTVTWRVTCLAGEAEPRLSGTPPWSGKISTPQPNAPTWACFIRKTHTLAPGEITELRFRIDVSITDSDAEHHNLPLPFDVDPAQTLANAENRYSDSIGPISTVSSDELQARVGLLRDGLAGLNGRFADNVACLCTADSSDFSCTFWWDSLFSSQAIARFNPDYARGAIRSVFTGQDLRDGSCGERQWNHQLPQRMLMQSPQSPIAAWAVERLARDLNDRSFAEEMWPKLIANHRFWEEFSDTDRDGLSEYRWSGQIADNSPLWDTCGMAADGGSGCGWLPPVASVPLNAFLYRDAGHLASLADLLGRPTESLKWRERQDRILSAFNAVCYVPSERRWWDFNHHTRQYHRVKTFYMFWPLMAGMPMSDETVRDLIENVLLDPSQFFGSVPFPSVAYDEPSYDPIGYWRGKAWPHITTWLCETLWRHGYHNEAEEAVRRTLSWFSSANGLPENLCTDATHTKPGGFPDYNWGCAAVALLASGDWRRCGP